MSGIRLCNIHCHMLYGVDDGARDAQEMYRMMDSAYKSGVRVICMTPHYNPAYFDTPVEATVRHFDAAVKYAKEKYPDLRLCLGQEIYYYHSSVEDILGGQCFTMNKTRNVLVEFGPYDDAATIKSGVFRLLTSGFYPVVAHVERYASFKRGTESIREMRQRGAKIQVNAASVIGRYGFMTKHYVMSLIKKGLVDIVADDCHNTTDKAVCLREAYDIIIRKFGKDTAARLFWAEPVKLLSGE